MGEVALDGFEIGRIRPPSEAQSLLVRVTRNCPWNRCTFCPVYKGERFSLRPVDDVVSDVRSMARVASALREQASARGEAKAVTGPVVRAFMETWGSGQEAMQVVRFLRDGGRSVFLQDANSLILPVDRLLRVLEAIREHFPTVTRITSYARSHTLVRRSIQDLERLRAAGLDRIHVGLESGSDEVLELVDKGTTAEQQIDAGRRVKAAGMELSEYVMPGLGGRALSEAHARETARVLRATDPDFIRLRTLAVPPGSRLEEQWQTGEFTPMDDVAVAHELRLLLGGLEGLTGQLVSDHVLNLFEEVEGHLPGDLPRMRSVVDRFLGLDEQRRKTFIVGRRLGLLRRLDQLDDPQLASHASLALEGLERRYPGSFEEAVREAKRWMI